MTNEEIAKLAGVVIYQCGAGWGGKYGWYRLNDPDVLVAGYKTEKKALEDAIGPLFLGDLGKLCLKLLKKHKV